MKILNIYRSLSIIIAIAFYFGCSEREFQQYYEHFEYTVETSRKKVDILFVIDNSSSMSFEQKKIQERFHGFLDRIKNFDYRLAMITTDISSASNEPRDINKNGKLQDGNLIEFITKEGNSTELYYLTPDLGYETAKEYFQSTIVRPETLTCEQFLKENNLDTWSEPLRTITVNKYCPSGDERGIHAAIKSFQSNYDFFRPNTPTTLIFVSDENERSFDSKNDYYNDLYPLEAYDLPETLISVFKEIFPSKTLLVHSIIIAPNDNNCKSIQTNQDQLGTVGFEGELYAELTKMTNRGIIGNICADNYTILLDDLGAETAELTNAHHTYCQGEPIDLQIEFFSGTPIEYHIENNDIYFNQILDPGTIFKIKYTCEATL